MLILKIFLLLTIVKRSQAFELRSPYAAHFYPKTPLDHRYPTFNRLADQSDQLNFGFPPSIQPPPNFAVDSHQQAFANAASVVPIAPTFPSFVQPVPNSYGAVPVSNGYGPAPYVPVQNGYGGAPSGYQSGGLGPLCPPVTVTATTQSSYGYYQSNSGYGGSSQSGSGQQESSKPLEYGESAYFPILPPVDLSRCFTRYTETRLVGSIPFLQNKTQGMEVSLEYFVGELKFKLIWV